MTKTCVPCNIKRSTDRRIVCTREGATKVYGVKERHKSEAVAEELMEWVNLLDPGINLRHEPCSFRGDGGKQ